MISSWKWEGENSLTLIRLIENETKLDRLLQKPVRILQDN